MLKRTVFVFCIFIIYSDAGKPDSPPQKLDLTNPFDMYVLSLVWPQTAWWNTNKYWHEIDKACTDLNVPKSDIYWTIHGLWPANYQGSPKPDPVTCELLTGTDTNLNPGVKTELEDKWPNYFHTKGVDSNTLWSHEWSKHGICATYDKIISSKSQYFSKTLELHSVYNIHKFLEGAGIVPVKVMPLPPKRGEKPKGPRPAPKPQNVPSGSATKTILYSEIQAALKKHLKVNPYIACAQQKGNRLHLHEIRLCYDRKFNLIDCDKKYSRLTNCFEPPNPNSTKPPKIDGPIEYPQRLAPCNKS